MGGVVSQTLTLLLSLLCQHRSSMGDWQHSQSQCMLHITQPRSATYTAAPQLHTSKLQRRSQVTDCSATGTGFAQAQQSTAGTTTRLHSLTLHKAGHRVSPHRSRVLTLRGWLPNRLYCSCPKQQYANGRHLPVRPGGELARDHTTARTRPHCDDANTEHGKGCQPVPHLQS